MAKNDLTAEELKSRFFYDASTGLFMRYINKGKSSKKVGGMTARGYIVIIIDGFLHKAHRLAWLYQTGRWPTDQIDHIDGDRANNKFTNLREVTNSINGQNIRKATKRSMSGLLGASKAKNGKWISSISLNRIYHYLGIFDTPVEAHEAYLVAKRELHIGCTI